MARAEIPIVVLDSAGNAVTGASVQINVRASGGPATIYQFETGPSTLANPLASAAGLVSGWLDRGAYTAVVSGATFATYTEYIDVAPAADGAVDSGWIAAGAVTATKLGAGAAAANLGSASLAVGTLIPGTNNQVVRVTGGVPTWGSVPTSGLSYSLSALSGGPPATPANTDVWIASGVGSLGERWAFQYDSSEVSAAKWKFIGGPPLVVSIATLESTTSTTFANLGTVGPQISVVRGGDYIVDFGCTVLGVSGQTCLACPSGAGVAAADIDAARVKGGSNGCDDSTSRSRLVTLTAAGTLTLQYRVTTGTGSFSGRFMSILPDRIS